MGGSPEGGYAGRKSLIEHSDWLEKCFPTKTLTDKYFRICSFIVY